MHHSLDELNLSVTKLALIRPPVLPAPINPRLIQKMSGSSSLFIFILSPATKFSVYRGQQKAWQESNLGFMEMTGRGDDPGATLHCLLKSFKFLNYWEQPAENLSVICDPLWRVKYLWLTFIFYPWAPSLRWMKCLERRVRTLI